MRSRAKCIRAQDRLGGPHEEVVGRKVDRIAETGNAARSKHADSGSTGLYVTRQVRSGVLESNYCAAASNVTR
jgi:hypothetical protein